MKKNRLFTWACGMIVVNFAVHALPATELPAATAGDSLKKNPSVFGEVNSLAFDGAGRALFIGSRGGLFRSDDGGRNWRKVALPLKPTSVKVTAVTPDSKDPKTLYVATRELGVFKSQDGGLVWQQIIKGLKSLEIRGLAVDANSPEKIYAAVRETRDAIYRSLDSGGKWSRVDMGPDGEVQSVTSVNISSGAGGIFLYAGTSAGLQRSPDCF